jgi:hypothetical protein
MRTPFPQLSQSAKAQTQANRYAFLVQVSNKRLLEQLLKKAK